MNTTPTGGKTLGRATIVFTDVEESVRATAALGNATYCEKMQNVLNLRVSEAIARHGGTQWREIGDSYLITFEYAGAALQCVDEVQRGLAREPITCADASGVTWTLRVRIGVHAAEAEVRLDDLKQLVGTDVNFAARILSLGRGGQIIVSDATHRAAAGGERFAWKEWPGRRVKSFDVPETVWELLWDGRSRGEPGSRWLPEWFSRNVNRFVGRGTLMDEIRKRLNGTSDPLLVLVGPPGVGKTRLAVETVLGLCAAFEAGVAFVPLADESHPPGHARTAAGLAAAIAVAVKAPPKVVEDAENRLVAFLDDGRAEQEWLIILDGWEAVDGRETLVWLGRAVRACRRARWLVTSAVLPDLVDIGRHRPVPPMELPTLDATALDEAEALQLFRARVEQRGEVLSLDDEASARAVHSILEQTEGHPLSIELAAAWVGDCTLPELADLLREDMLKVLRAPQGGHKAGPARHQSLEASLYWLTQLLPADQQAALHRLARLPETFSPKQAADDQGLNNDWLIRWRKVGLLERVGPGETTRYQLRRAVREYCRRLGPPDPSPRPAVLRTLDDANSTLADLIAAWAYRDRAAWSRHVEVYRRLSEQVLQCGETLLALAVVNEGLGHWPTDVRLRQLLGLTLVRSGAVYRAWTVLSALAAEGHDDPETLGLLGRAHKGLAAASDRPEERAEHLREAYATYRSAYVRHGEPWLGINAATLAMVVGEGADAEALARGVRDRGERELFELEDERKDLFWTLATLGEAELLLGDYEEAAEYYRRAVRGVRGRFGTIKSARDNARLLLAMDRYAAARETITAALTIPDVVIFVGHMIDRPGREGEPRFPASAEKAVGREIRRRLEASNALIGYSSAACGSDILFLEALHGLKGLGAESHVVLPYARDQFLKDSVDIVPGSNWATRFERCLARAEVVTCSPRRLEYQGLAYRFANLFLQGLAATRAEELETGLRFLAVWDGRPGDGPGGTADHVARWRAKGHEVDVISLPEILGRPAPAAAEAPAAAGPSVPIFSGPGMRIMAFLFARVVGFDTLLEEQFPAFVDHFLGLIARRLAETAPEPMKRNSWGDGIFLAFDGVRDAGLAALDLCAAVSATDWTAYGLPAGLALRVGLHAGPVFYARDPVTGRFNAIGDHAARAAAVEAANNVGRPCASPEFAALAAAEGLSDLRCHYLGQTAPAPAGEPIALYEVRPAGRGPRAAAGPPLDTR